MNLNVPRCRYVIRVCNYLFSSYLFQIHTTTFIVCITFLQSFLLSLIERAERYHQRRKKKELETKKRKSNVSFFLNPLSYSTTTSKCRHTNVLLWYQVNKSQSALWLTSKIDKLQANRFWYDCNTIFVKMPFFSRMYISSKKREKVELTFFWNSRKQGFLDQKWWLHANFTILVIQWLAYKWIYCMHLQCNLPFL